jgi:hypothetical protein
MKNKTRLPKLTLHKQTLRTLTSEESRRVAGGRITPGGSSGDPTACVVSTNDPTACAPGG